MPDWYFKPIGDGIFADLSKNEISDYFLPILKAKGFPTDMAVFVHHEVEDLHCDWNAYFSPATAKLAIAFGAVPCAQPPREGLELLIGSVESWSALF